MQIKDRIRGYLPVVIDIETGGFNDKTDAMLEICAITIDINEQGVFYPKDVCHFHIEPFKGANLEAAALKFNGIDVHNPLRMAVSEKQALNKIFQTVSAEVKAQECTRAILVGHNAFFDLGFLVILPVYHNAGRAWPKGGFIKYPNTITVVIGKPISVAGKSATVLIKEIRDWTASQAVKY
jgi:ribonuclease T